MRGGGRGGTRIRRWKGRGRGGGDGEWQGCGDGKKRTVRMEGEDEGGLG